MYNHILDRLPEDFKGWLIRTDYRIGIQIQLCLSDLSLSEEDRLGTALSLLYGKGLPDIRTAFDGLTWFMNCGIESAETTADDGPALYSFEYDSARIVSAFKKVFGIDISREKIHWFQFVPMLGELDGTSFASVMEIRRTSANDVDAKRRSEFVRMKKRFSLPNQYTEEEEATINSILEKVKSQEG